ncbi:DUF2723 domain-containing protein [Algibacter amylolyticus]|uniref:DUF2723 domain-containing protein n=1 Tax=Algibacter amylolyticus TaxID=1608400 RepID=A0A5M7B1W8_9FLAO|nr:DUF2723 domain-containing protein [Algibacter amylolyticus]KAA5823613.1 DUF2723 domain-containing protein [Algibacter amylolyticus]MBB5267772.1 tetratricopeptide (TPR) repeat protein [Algibacter amylolyticus]TSJ74101.1 DUF2723 domain-containing protein [Algibacter amylolyticus]
MLNIKRIVNLILFTVVFVVYGISAPRTISFWDSSEFITSSYNLQASHPPGSPLYTMFCSVVFQFFPSMHIAFISNLISAFFGALTVCIVFNTTYYITSSIQDKKTKSHNAYLPYLTGITSALTLAFSDSFWTASTETEVYTLSFALMMGMFYTMLKWANGNNKKKDTQLLLLFGFLLGLASSVHLITITLVIPLTILFTYKKYGLTLKNTILSLVVGCFLFVVIYLLIIQGLIKMAHSLDVWFVNSLSFPMNTGIVAALAFLIILFSITLWTTYKKQKTTLHTATLAIIFFLIGLSCYFMPLQRASASSTLANNINNSNRLLQYIKGEQFGINNIPFIKGPTYNAPIDNNTPFIDGKPTLTFDNSMNKYMVVDNGVYKHPNYSKEFSMFFPRLFDYKNESSYKAWTPIKGTPIDYEVNGSNKTIYKPTYTENFNFFIEYQVKWLNLRYLFWNFVGKQNSSHGLGHIKHGNWISGINSLDKSRIGDISSIPERYKNDKSNDGYYFLPLIFGVLGLVSIRKNKLYLATTFFTFLTFGIGVTLYVNPVPSSILIRERDYIFIGSFVIFSLWVGLSINLIFNYLKLIVSNKTSIFIAFTIVFIAAPLQLLAKGWDNHQRSRDTFSYDLGKAYLDACPKQAILITNGDNMTFPLWYLQDVENYRTDVRVLNYDQLNINTYIENLKQKIHDSKPITFNLNKKLYINGSDILIPLKKETDNAVKLDILFQFLHDSTTRINWNGKKKHYIPATKFSIPTDNFIALNPDEFNASKTKSITWDYKKDFYSINDLVLFNVINNNFNNRPICFAFNGNKNHYLGLDNYLVKNGLVEYLAPLKRTNNSLNPKIVNTKMMLPYLLEKATFKGFNDETIHLNSENKSYAQTILRPSYYFLAQALLEENKTKEAIKVLDTCFSLFPDKSVAYKQYAFALGKLYFKAGLEEKGVHICQLAINNILEELEWITSLSPPNPIINVIHAEKLKKMYMQMQNQFSGNTKALDTIEMKKIDETYNLWKQQNWPY